MQGTIWEDRENLKASHRDGLFAFLAEDFFLVQSVSERMRRGEVGSRVELALQKKKAHNPLTENALKDNLESKVCDWLKRVGRCGGGGDGDGGRA